MRLLGCLAIAVLLSGCAERPLPKPKPSFVQTGIASWYGRELAGKRTATGERYNPNKLVAAHRTLPIGTVVTVTNLANGKSVKVTIADRGPFVHGRIIDLSDRAAREIDLKDDGLGEVRLVVHPEDQPQASGLPIRILMTSASVSRPAA